MKPAPTPLLTSWHQNPGRFYLYVLARVIAYDILPEDAGDQKMTRPTLASFKQKALNDPEVRAEEAYAEAVGYRIEINFLPVSHST